MKRNTNFPHRIQQSAANQSKPSNFLGNVNPPAKPEVFDIVRLPVNSSNIKSMGYCPASKTLEIEFYKRGSGDGGDVWRYTPVAPAIFKGLKDSKSIGGYFAEHIRNNKEIKAEKQIK